MEGLILLALAIPIGLLVGWWMGISAWRQVRTLRAEVAALRQALEGAGIRAPRASAATGANPSLWAQPPEVDAQPAAQPAPNPWRAPAQAPAGPDLAEPAATEPALSPPAAPPRPGFEELLTLRWGTWLGAAALLLAGVFLLRMAVEEGWLGPAARCVLAALLGLTLVGAAEWLRRRPEPPRALPWPDYAPPALAAGGVAMLFGAAYAVAVLYALVPPLAGFGLMAAVALAGIALALVQGPLVAVVGILGAYATPLLVESDAPWLPGLFAYLLLVTAAALAVLRQVGAAWLGWAATFAGAAWVVLGGAIGDGADDLWSPALFAPAAAGLHLALLPSVALDGILGRRLAWIPFAALALAGLTLVPAGGLAPALGLLLLTPVAVAKGAREPRLDLLPALAALAGLLMLLAWPVGPWAPPGEELRVEGVVLAVLPGAPWPDAALRPFLALAAVLALAHALAGLAMERRASRPLRWAALTAAVPVLALLIAYARIRGFAPDSGWAAAALALAAALVGTATLAHRAGDPARAGIHAAGVVAALALGAAMLLREAWLTTAFALFLPPLAWVAARVELPALRKVALAVATVVLVRLLLNPAVLGYAFGTAPLLNGLLLAYGLPAASFALAAWMFRRQADDLTVAALEAASVAFTAALVLLEARHLAAGGALPGPEAGWTFREAALQVTGLSVLSTLLRLADQRLRRPVLRHGWRLLAGAAALLGTLLVGSNPAVNAAEVSATLILNELLLAYAIPALLAGLALREPVHPPALRRGLAAYALLAAFAWVTLAVRHAFHPDAMADADPSGAELYAYSGAWLALGAALLTLGIRTGARPLRLAALGLMALTVGKAFLVDMADLEGLWRVLSFLALGLALIALGWVYRRFVVAGAPAPA